MSTTNLYGIQKNGDVTSSREQMAHKIKVKMLQGVDLTPSTKTYLFRTSLTGLAQGDIVKVNTTNGVQLAKVVKYCDKSPNVPTQDVFERVPESKIQTVQNEIFKSTLLKYGFDSDNWTGINYDVPIKEHQNALIKANAASDKEMREYGFTDHREDTWYYCVMLSEVSEISFSCTIDKNTNHVQFDVLDEDWLQPYDYQSILKKDQKHYYALLVHAQVQKQMHKLQELGVIYGYIPNDYI